MGFCEVKEEVKVLNFDERRTDCDNYFEGVIAKDSLTQLGFILERLLGEPVWPSRSRLPFHVEEAIRNYGGVLGGQTLYFWTQGQDSVFAMLWPWKDGRHVTVKIAKR